jgi:hypothetical protein
MVPVTAEWMRAIYEPSRKVACRALLSLIDVTGKEDATLSASDSQAFGSAGKALSSPDIAGRIATCEPGQFKLDGSMYLFPDDPLAVNLGWWTRSQSDENGAFSTVPELLILFSGSHTAEGITLRFASVPGDIRVAWLDAGGNEKSSAQVTATDLSVEIRNQVSDYYGINIRFLGGMPYHYIRLYQIDFGIAYAFEEHLGSAEVVEEMDITSNQLISNTSTIVIGDTTGRLDQFDKDSLLPKLQERQPVSVDIALDADGMRTWIPVSRGYLKNWKSLSQWSAQIVSTDRMEQLEDNIWFKSRMYNNDTVETILREIFEDAGVKPEEYSIHDNIKTVQLTGYIEPMTHRAALQKVVFAACGVCRVDRYGVIQVYRDTEEARNQGIAGVSEEYRLIHETGRFYTAQDPMLPGTAEPVPEPIKIPANAMGGIDAKTGQYYNAVTVVNYFYLVDAVSSELFSAEVLGDSVITFDPAMNITVTGDMSSYVIHTGAVEVFGATGQVIVNGYKFNRYQQEITRRLPKESLAEKENTLTVKDITIICTEATASEVAAWMLDLLQKRTAMSFAWWNNPAVEPSDYAVVPIRAGVEKIGVVTKSVMNYTGGLSGSLEVVV